MRQPRTYGSVGAPGGQPPGATRHDHHDHYHLRVAKRCLSMIIVVVRASTYSDGRSPESQWSTFSTSCFHWWFSMCMPAD